MRLYSAGGNSENTLAIERETYFGLDDEEGDSIYRVTPSSTSTSNTADNTFCYAAFSWSYRAFEEHIYTLKPAIDVYDIATSAGAYLVSAIGKRRAHRSENLLTRESNLLYSGHLCTGYCDACPAGCKRYRDRLFGRFEPQCGK